MIKALLDKYKPNLW